MLVTVIELILVLDCGYFDRPLSIGKHFSFDMKFLQGPAGIKVIHFIKCNETHVKQSNKGQLQHQ